MQCMLTTVSRDTRRQIADVMITYKALHRCVYMCGQERDIETV